MVHMPLSQYNPGWRTLRMPCEKIAQIFGWRQQSQGHFWKFLNAPPSDHFSPTKIPKGRYTTEVHTDTSSPGSHGTGSIYRKMHRFLLYPVYGLQGYRSEIQWWSWHTQFTARRLDDFVGSTRHLPLHPNPAFLPEGSEICGQSDPSTVQQPSFRPVHISRDLHQGNHCCVSLTQSIESPGCPLPGRLSSAGQGPETIVDTPIDPHLYPAKIWLDHQFQEEPPLLNLTKQRLSAWSSGKD